jgi:hypothetical protein
MNGDAVLAGWTAPSSGVREATLVAVTPQGVLDSTFGSAGTLSIADGSNSIQASSILNQQDGTFLVAASDSDVGGVILHVTSGGNLDTSYGSTGFNRVPGQHAVSFLASMVADPQGRLVLTGIGPSQGSPVATSPVAIVRLHPDGTIDGTFGTDGSVEEYPAQENQFSGETSRGTSVTIAPTGNIIAAGEVTDGLSDPIGRGFLVEVQGGSVPPPCPTGVTHLAAGEPWAVAAMTAMVNGRQCAGYWVVTRAGGVTAIGAAAWLGDMSGQALNTAMIGIAATPDGSGYYLLGSDGGIFTFGDATFHGSTGNKPLNAPVVAMAVAPAGDGYWLVASDGGIFAFGNAPFYGSMGGHALTKPVVGISADVHTGGYWMVASDGGIFTFNAPFYGSMGGQHLNQPVVGMTPQPDGLGYRMVASDGGVFNFGDASYYGSLPGQGVRNPNVTTMAGSADGNGYYLINGTGTVWAFGDAPYLGNA